MLREFLALLPESLGECSLGIAIGGALLGLVLWLAGARFSRSLVTLIGVAIGTSVGMRLPGWLGWSIDGMAIGVGGAVVLGASGYLLHRSWIGLYLGALSVALGGGGVVDRPYARAKRDSVIGRLENWHRCSLQVDVESVADAGRAQSRHRGVRRPARWRVDDGLLAKAQQGNRLEPRRRDIASDDVWDRRADDARKLGRGDQRERRIAGVVPGRSGRHRRVDSVGLDAAGRSMSSLGRYAANG